MTRPLSRTGISLGIASALQLAAGATTSTVQLLAIGESPTRNGEPRKVVVADLAHAEAIVAASLARAGASEIVIDYDHQTVFAASAAGRAEAAGWVKRLYASAEGVMAEVEWTATAAAKLGEKLYRYISPYFTFDKASGRVSSVINAGLTNTPNLELAAVASAGAHLFTEEEDDTMNLKAIASALGLGDDADEAAILAAIAASKAKGDALAATASALGVTLGDDVTAVATAATALKTAADAGKPDPSKFVPIETVASLQTGLASANARLDAMAAKDRQSRIDAAVAEGRLTPALVEHAKTITDDTALASFLAALPATSLGKSSIDGGEKPGSGDGDLTADERAVATAMGMTEEEFLAAKKKEA